jgi:peptidoglycan/LPS O-acetylase OafA/YrhL
MAANRVPQLDALRGIAILLVILHNESNVFPSLHLERVFANGWMGVDLFFVLSGFLITGILIDDRSSDRYFTSFYARRCLRIWPLYYSLLLFMFVIVPWLRPSEAGTVFGKSSPWWAYPLFLQNFLVVSPTNAAGPLAVTWSLAIEEQFYLVWPWVIRYWSLAQVRTLALAVICVSPLARFCLSFFDVNLYTNVFCRLDGLMAGAVLAIAVRTQERQPSRRVSYAWTTLMVCLPLAFVTESMNARWIVFSLSALSSAALVYIALLSSGVFARRVLNNAFVVYTGTISYGLYLLHKIPFDAAKPFLVDRRPLLALPLLLAACYGVAWLSWISLEKPFLRLKRHFRPTGTPPTVSSVAGAAGHALTVVRTA